MMRLNMYFCIDFPFICSQIQKYTFVRYIVNNLQRSGKLFAVVIAVLLLGFYGCGKPHYETDTSGMETGLSIRRFEQDLFALDLNGIAEAIPGLYDEYGEFLDLFNYRIINIGGAHQPTYPDYLKVFLTDYLNNQVYQETMKVFPDLSGIEEQISAGFDRYMIHFPEKPVPSVYTFVSRFNQSIVTAEGILGIGLDNYLGRESEYYERLGKHSYQIINMYPGKIPTDCFLGWGMTEFEYNDSIDNVLHSMIYNGKIAYFTKWMLPEQPDSMIMGFTAAQMKFCLNNEDRMWEYMVENKVLFNSDRLSIQKFTGYGPFTSDFTRESPARAAVWMGWRIVEAYARNHPELSLRDVMKEDDYQNILTLSKYHP